MCVCLSVSLTVCLHTTHTCNMCVLENATAVMDGWIGAAG